MFTLFVNFKSTVKLLLSSSPALYYREIIGLKSPTNKGHYFEKNVPELKANKSSTSQC